MRGWPVLALAAPLLLAGCGGEPNFDKRYHDESARIEAQAANMQAELDARLNAAAAAQSNMSEPSGAMPANAVAAHETDR